MHCLFKGTLSALYKDVNVVHPFLLSCGEPLENQQVRELLKRLGVHELEPQELLEQHIYPSIRSNKWKVPYCLYWIAKMVLNLFRIKDVMVMILLGLNDSFSFSRSSLIPPPVKAWASGGELLGFHQAAFHLLSGVLKRCSTSPHLQGPAVPGQWEGALLCRVRQHRPAKKIAW